VGAVVVVVAPRPAVVLVVGAGGAVVVVEAVPVAAVVLVVVDAVPDVDVVDVVGVVVVGAVGVVGVVVGAGPGLTRFFSVVPVSAPPKIVESGLPEISSTAVTNSNASTKTTATVPAMARQEKPGCVARRAMLGGAGAVAETGVTCRRCVAGVSVAAGTSRRSVSAAGDDEAGVDAIWTVSAAPVPSVPDCPTTSVGADEVSTEEADGSLAPV
jgi:hypothetical protein